MIAFTHSLPAQALIFTFLLKLYVRVCSFSIIFEISFCFLFPQ